MMIVVTILTYTVSLFLQLPLCMTIHNRCIDIELVSSAHFSNGTTYPQLSGRQIGINGKMRAYFEINATKFRGAILFKLKKHIKSYNQHDMDISTTETNHNEAKYVYLLVAWKVKYSRPFVHVALIEHTKEFTWNEAKLKKLYCKNHSWFKEYNGTTIDKWFVDDSMSLKTTIGTNSFGRNFELSITISKGKKSAYHMRPLCVNLKR
jgi:hypothetical protein